MWRNQKQYQNWYGLLMRTLSRFLLQFEILTFPMASNGNGSAGVGIPVKFAADSKDLVDRVRSLEQAKTDCSEPDDHFRPSFVNH